MRWSSLPLLVGCAVAATALCGSAPGVVTGAAVAVGSPTLAAAQRIGLDGAAEGVAAAELNQPLEEVRFPDGTVAVRVARQYFHTVVVCRHADGHYGTECPEHAP